MKTARKTAKTTATPKVPAKKGLLDGLTDDQIREVIAIMDRGSKYRIPTSKAMTAAGKVIGDAVRASLPPQFKGALVSVTVWEATEDGKPASVIGNEWFI